LGKIGEAVKSTVPQEMWAAIVEKLEQLEQHPETLDVGEDGFDDTYDDPYDPTEFIDEDDEFDLGSEPSPRAMGTAASVDGAFAVHRTRS
jgi:hypothetical protein